MGRSEGRTSCTVLKLSVWGKSNTLTRKAEAFAVKVATEAVLKALQSLQEGGGLSSWEPVRMRIERRLYGLAASVGQKRMWTR